MSAHEDQARNTDRRTFIKAGTSAVAAAPLLGSLAARTHAASDETIKVALVGCGLRGTGAAVQALSTAGPVKLWAMADAFQDRIDQCIADITSGKPYQRSSTEGLAAKLDVPPERRFVGLDAYQKAIDSGADVVLLVTPPGFRPAHFEYAVKQRKHVFMEKPLAVDAPGVRRILAASEEAKKHNLKVGVGLQRHHELPYQQTIQRLHDGAIGDPVTLWAYWMGAAAAPSKSHDRVAGRPEFEHQVRNWYYFTYLGGDHNVEQHIHNIDVCNWLMKAHPISAQGMGGRQVRTDPKYGQIFDHHMVEYTYADGTKLVSQCRQIPNCFRSTSEHAYGTKGYSNISGGIIQDRAGKDIWKFKGQSPNPYQVEHDVLFDAIRNNKSHNEVEPGAMATMTMILGRMATYSGQIVRWDNAFASDLALAPKLESLAFDSTPPVLPDVSGHYPVAMPGQTKVL